MNSKALTDLIKVAKKHKIKAKEWCGDIIENSPHKDMLEKCQDHLQLGGRQCRKLFEDLVHQYKHGGHQALPPCVDTVAEERHLIVPLKQGVFISKYFHGKNFDDCDTLFVGRHGQPKNVFRTLLQFDLDIIPDNCIIIKAELCFSLCSNELPSGGAPIYLHAILSNWSAASVTWDNGPEMAREYWKAYIPGRAQDEICIDVINYIQDYFECPNYGLMLVGNESTPGVIGIEARDCGPRRDAPYLRLELECGDEE